jgi:tetrathionate reductase subunit B
MSKARDTATMNRRGFVRGAAMAVAAVSLTRLAASAAAELDSPSAAPRYGMLIDTSRCARGCSACVEACEAEHGLQGHHAPLTDAQWIRKVELRHKSTGRRVSMPVMCQHCEHPPCVDVCPTGASFKRVDGLVLVDKHLCIGCRYCMMACPYKARSFIHEVLTEQLPEAPRGKGTVESCTLCVHRIDAQAETQRDPACAEACTRAGHKAIVFGDLHDPASAVAGQLRNEPSRALRQDLELNPGVRYQGI